MAGQPPKFKNKEELQACIDRYKEYLESNGKPPTIAGLAYYTGIDRQTIYNYKAKDEFFDTIKGFVDYILFRWEELGLTDSSAGLIFIMKNYGYTDKMETINTNLNAEMSLEEAENIIAKLGGKSD